MTRTPFDALDAKPAGMTRPMVEADMPAVGRLFRKVFRGVDQDAGEGLLAFLRDLAFGSPSYVTRAGSSVYQQPDGTISSAVLAVPMRFVAGDKCFTARMLCAFMAESASTLGGAGALSLAARARQHDLQFTDTASPVSMKHFQAWGGINVPLQNLGWVRTFRPIGATLDRVSRRVRHRRGRSFVGVLRPLDTFLRASFRSVAAPGVDGLRVEPMPVARFLDEAPGFVARYGVHPLWSREELGWLLDIARQNTALGTLTLMAVKDGADRLVGCFVFYARGRTSAEVLNVLALRRREADVLGAMFHAFDRLGFMEARGRAQPALMEGLARQSMLTFHHEAFVCIGSRHPEVMEAVRRGDIYIGGLAGEGWSRLMSDFR